jgi:hypothetical protein
MMPMSKVLSDTIPAHWAVPDPVATADRRPWLDQAEGLAFSTALCSGG